MAAPNPAMQDAARASQPGTGAIELTTGALATTGRGLIITTTGNIVFVMLDGSSVTWNSIPVGMYGGLCIKSITSVTAAGYVLL